MWFLALAAVLPGAVSGQQADGGRPPRLRSVEGQRFGAPPRAVGGSGARPARAAAPHGGGSLGVTLAPSAAPGGSAAQAVPLAAGWMRLVDAAPGLHDYGYAAAIAPGGEVYVVGEVEGAPGDWDVGVLKLDRHGKVLWRRSHAGSGGGRDVAWHVELDPQGNVVVEADTVELQGGTDMTILKYDPQGSLLWASSYDGPGSGYDGYDGGVATAVDAAGNVVTVGTSWGGTSYDLVALKLAPDGTLLWERRYDGGGWDDGYGVVLDAAGNAYATGDAEVAGSRDFLTMKLLPSGAAEWVRTWDSPYGGAELVYAVNLDGLGNVLVTGTSWDLAFDDDVSTVTYDAAGNERWSRQYGAGNGSFDLPLWVVGDALGNVSVVGFTQVFALGTCGLAVSYDVLGNEAWSDAHVHPSFEAGLNRFTDAELDAAGNLVVAGRSYTGAADAHDCQLVVYSPAGQRLGDESLDLGQHGVDHLSNLHRDSAGRIHATGYGLGPGGTVDTLVVKLAANGLSFPELP